MNDQCMEKVRSILSSLPPRKNVVEFGSYNVNGSVRPLFDGIPYVGIDIRPGPGVDLVYPAETFTPRILPDTVVCLSVLEHTPNAERIIENAYRILVTGGIVILEAAAPDHPIHGVDGGPVGNEFYYAVSEDTLRDWARKFRILHSSHEGMLVYLVGEKE